LVRVVRSELGEGSHREISSGGAKIGDDQSTEGVAASALTVDSGGGTVVATIPVGGNPAGVAYNSGNGYVYVTNPFSDIVSVINGTDRKSTRLNSSHEWISYAVFCLKKKNSISYNCS